MIAVAMYAVAILAICLLLPVGVFLHELGHAIPPVVAGGRAHVVVGSEEGRTLEVGPIRVTVGANGIWSPLYFGYCDWGTITLEPFTRSPFSAVRRRRSS